MCTRLTACASRAPSPPPPVQAPPGGLRLNAPCGAAETALDTATKTTLASAIRNSADVSNAIVRDAVATSVQGGTCTSSFNGVSAIGAKVNVDGTCWQHSHPQAYNVYEMNNWAIDHPGNANFMSSANPIKAVARSGRVVLSFPASHAVGRLATAISSGGLNLLGKMGESVSFTSLPTSVQTADVATAFNALQRGEALESCGSIGEVANDPTLGHHFFQDGPGQGTYWQDNMYVPLNKYHGYNREIHLQLALYGKDQLRQRAAHALIQIFVISYYGIDFLWNTEMWSFYYDTLVRHAFGSYRDIMREVSYSAMMGAYLTYQGSASLASSATLPDENYAREIMQLFTIGLIKLNDDGSYIVDPLSGEPLETYDTSNIKEFAKCWTGFDQRPMRTNIEKEGHGRGNRIDPMQLKANGADTKRDLFPKLDLHDAYLGDQYPLCADLPKRHFLSKGARWSYLGSSPTPRLQPETMHSTTQTALNALGADWVNQVPRVKPSSATSALYSSLCDAPSGNSECRFRSEITLPSTLACDTNVLPGHQSTSECSIDTVSVVDIFDPIGNRTVFYEYVRPPCVELTYFAGTVVKAASWLTPNGMPMCADRSVEAAAAGCCAPGHGSSAAGKMDCAYVTEVMSYDTAIARCAARTDGLTAVCGDRAQVNSCFGTGAGGYAERSWLNESFGSCGLQAQVFSDGSVTLVDPSSADAQLAKDSGNIFRVRWLADGSFPSGNCSFSGCSRSTSGDASCVCDTTVNTYAVFTDLAALPTQGEIEEELRIGAPPPDTFAAGEYLQCTTAACTTAAASGVRVYTHKDSGGALDDKAVFRILRNGTRITYLANKVSNVTVAGGAFAFRNPPKFHSFLRPSIRDAEHETEALLDFLHWHSNHPPFVAKSLIKRFTSSNPSPRYVKAVADAFKTGTFGGVTYGGTYGDLGATFAAILLDNEARSPTLDADPTHGQLREPLLKVYHVLRSFDFKTGQGQHAHLSNLEGDIGQQHLMSPTVFNFYVSRAPGTRTSFAHTFDRLPADTRTAPRASSNLMSSILCTVLSNSGPAVPAGRSARRHRPRRPRGRAWHRALRCGLPQHNDHRAPAKRVVRRRADALQHLRGRPKRSARSRS